MFTSLIIYNILEDWSICQIIRISNEIWLPDKGSIQTNPDLVPGTRIITAKCVYLFKCLLFFCNSCVNLQNVFRHFFLFWVWSWRFYGTHIWGVDTWNRNKNVWAKTLQVNWGKFCSFSKGLGPRAESTMPNLPFSQEPKFYPKSQNQTAKFDQNY